MRTTLLVFGVFLGLCLGATPNAGAQGAFDSQNGEGAFHYTPSRPRPHKPFVIDPCAGGACDRAQQAGDRAQREAASKRSQTTVLLLGGGVLVLLAAGFAVSLGRSSSGRSGSTSAAGGVTADESPLAERLRQLQSARDEGLISEAEHERVRRAWLGLW